MTAAAVRPATQDTAVESLLQIAETTLTVSQLATTKLYSPRAAASVGRVRAHMEEMGYDAAPVSEASQGRYVTLADLRSASGTVHHAAKAISLSQLVTADLPLSQGVGLLVHSPFYFILDGNQLTGIVTRSDLQRPAISMVLLSLIIAAEPGLDRLIVRSFGDEWVGRLDEGERKRIEGRYGKRVKANMEISLLDSLTLGDRLMVLRGHQPIVRQLSDAVDMPFPAWCEKLRSTRNRLAHGSGLLDAEPDPLAAIRLFDKVRAFAETVWRLSGPGR